MSPGWWIERGPNGGYVAAVVLRALATAVDDPTRTPRSFTVHYLAPPAAGSVQIDVQTERTGRMLTFVSGRVHQDGRLIATAQAAFAPPLPGVEFCDLQPPDALPPEAIEPMVPARRRARRPDARALRAALGGRLAALQRRPAGGRRRLDPAPPRGGRPPGRPPAGRRPHRRVDAAGLLPGRRADGGADRRPHHPLPLSDPAGRCGAWYLAVFRSQMAIDGFVEEDGEVWSADGRLLAHSRQLAVLLPRPG